MLVLSFSVDYCVYKICVLYKHSYNRCLTTLASSYVMLVYSTRTLTNTLEMVKMYVFQLLFCSSFEIFHPPVFGDLADLLGGALHQANVGDRIPPFHAQGGARQGRDHEGEGRVSLPRRLSGTHLDFWSASFLQVAATRKKKLIPDHDFKHFLPISVLVVAGTFNRPTFPAFAAAPVFFWLQRGVATNSYFTPFQVYQSECRLTHSARGENCSVLLFRSSIFASRHCCPAS